MSMTDGNPETKEVKAVIDPMQVAQLVRELQRQDQANVAAQKESRFQKRVQGLLSGGNVDKENLDHVSGLVSDAVADLKDELTTQSGQTSVQSMTARYAEAVQDALDKFIDGDEQLSKVGEHLQNLTLKKLGADASVMGKFNTGQVDKQTVKAYAKEVVEDFAKSVLKRDRQAKGPAIPAGVPGAVANAALENSAPAGNIDDILEPHRREAYFKLKALYQRNRIAPEEAHKKAFAMATKQFKKGGSAA